ncbi:MAG TPA: TetR/AcrR family transcriptional regulator [Chthonomonadales bacterium]|nr:TetR/AcrR family transcriptional regulator [Chthonomonadales bacterium]
MHKSVKSEPRRRQILEAALQVFSTSGFEAATNKQIAGAAGIRSAGLIYHYFASKEDLLRGVIEHFSAPLRLLSQRDLMMESPPEIGLARFCDAWLEMAQDPIITRCRTVLIREAMRSPELAETLGQIIGFRIRRSMAAYLAVKMEEGTLRRADPEAAAQCFLGPLASYLLMGTIFQPAAVPADQAASVAGGASIDNLVRLNLDVFLRGMRPEREEAPEG